MKLAEKVILGDVRALGRAISLVENEHPDKHALLEQLAPHCGKAMVWGITGSPGSGKSTLIDRLLTHGESHRKLAVLAVDPTSPQTGGAFLGDRLRMQSHAQDQRIFIRSIASRGKLGGISSATGDAIKVLDAAGYELIIIETVGIGQSEIDVRSLADVLVLVLNPGSGDSIQLLKAWIVEVADVFVINKCDKAEANRLSADLDFFQSLKMPTAENGRRPVVITSATLDKGIDELWRTLLNCQDNLVANGSLRDRRARRIQEEISDLVAAKMQEELTRFMNDTGIVEKLSASSLGGGKSIYALRDEILSEFWKDFYKSQ